MDKSKEELVDSVCRNVVEPPPVEQPDTVMEDCSQAQEIQTDGKAYKAANSSMEYDTVGINNGRGWTHDGGWVEPSSNSWNTSEATVYSNW